MPETIELSVSDIEALTVRALKNSGANDAQASALARAVAAAEQDGTASHGLAYVPTYCLHLQCGKVNRTAIPKIEVEGVVVRVDADAGFAHLPIAIGVEALIPLAKTHGVAALAVTNSYNCGVLGFHTETIAAQGLVALGFTNAPASISAWGGSKPMFGTNPWSLAVPDNNGGAAFVIDQSASVVAKSEVMKHQREGKSLPVGWALDKQGKPTTNADEALAGSMLPAGGYKGVGSALLVEIFAACLTGSTLGMFASPFSGAAGGPPRTGQFFLAINPAMTSGGLFQDRLHGITGAFAENENTRLPGARRKAARERYSTGLIPVAQATYESVVKLGVSSPLV